jgi:hypothetical protein
MGWKPSFLPNRVLECMNREDRPKGPAGMTSQEAETKRVFELEIELHNQFWGFLRRNDFEDVEYSNPRRSTRARRGRPDFLICRGSRRLGIEFKIRPNKLSPDQIKFFEMAKRQTNTCLCCYDYSSAVSAMESFFNFKAL